MDIDDAYNWNVYEFFKLARRHCDLAFIREIEEYFSGEPVEDLIEIIQDSIYESLHKYTTHATESEVVTLATNYLYRRYLQE